MTVYIYARVSTVEQASEEKSSLDDQIERCKGALQVARVKDEPTIIMDPGISGSIPLSERPGGKAMWDSLKSGDMVMASKLDRLFRSAHDALNTVSHFQTNNVDLVLIDISVDPVTKSAIAKMFLTILSGVAEFEKYRILERTSDGRKGKKDSGGHIGGRAPYGFKITGEKKTSKLVPLEGEQYVISIIKGMNEKNASIGDIIKHLIGLGIMSRSGKPFVQIQISRIIERN